MSEQPRKRTGARGKKARPPVLSVTCPQCGGSVNDADLGERTECQYCGTALHLPTVDFTPDSAPPPPPARVRAAMRAELPFDDEGASLASRRSTNKNLGLVVLTVACIACIVGFVALAPSPGPPGERPQAATPLTNSDPDGVMENANCTIDCNKPCMNISDPSALVACFDKCTEKCKFVGKGTPQQCRSRCTTTCAAAPDAQSRASCEAGCNAGCP